MTGAWAAARIRGCSTYQVAQNAQEAKTMKRMRTKVALAIATAGVLVAMLGSASAAVPGKCVVVHRNVRGSNVTLTICV